MTGGIGLLITIAAVALLALRVALGAAWLDRGGAARARLLAFDVVVAAVVVAFVAVVVVRFDRMSL